MAEKLDQNALKDDPGSRRVRTTEGARFFGLPVGSLIGNTHDPNAKASTRATSLVRLRSLQRQFDVAKKVGNNSRMRDIQAEFTAAVKDYAATNGQLTDVLDSLVASRGRADKAIGEAPTDPSGTSDGPGEG